MEICVWLKLRQNGVVSDLMKNAGVIYSQNYGVSLPDIKEYSAQSVFLSYELDGFWQSGVREKMIIFTYAYPPCDIDIEKATELASKLCNPEIADLAAVNLFSKSDLAVDIALSFIESENDFIKRCGFVMLSKLLNFYNNLIMYHLEDILKEADKSISDKSVCVSIAICRFLNSFFVFNNPENKIVSDWISRNNGNDFFRRIIWHEISTYYAEC